MIESVAIIAVITALTEIIKNLGVPSTFAPVVAIFLGVTAALAFGGVSPETVFAGIVYGLSAMGLYSGSKTTIKAIQ